MNTPALKCCYVLIAAIIICIIPATRSLAQVANVTIDIPAPHGGDLGVIAGGLAFQSRTRNSKEGFHPDGNVGLSVGLGDLRKLLGVVVAANIFGLSNEIGEDDNLGSGTLDIQLNRAINDYVFVGGGVRSLVNWRPPSVLVPRNNRSFFITGNCIIPLSRQYERPFSLLFITAGAGNGIYRRTRDFDIETSGKFNLFGSIALQVFRGGNVIAEWNGYTLNAGLSVYPFKKHPALGGTFSLASLTEGNIRFICSVGYSVRIGEHQAMP
ncbi:MAG: hypothetical protein H6564_19890 [Lewinellaceae bacterium]|nr:hypothetical protein [Lewinellaceae bacterium]